MINQKRRFIFIIFTLLGLGFMLTSFASYFVSRESLRSRIETSDLPLTSDNIYSEIQRDLLRPVFISSLMANDTFLRDWIINGEKDESLIRKYLKEIKTKYGTFTSFLVSERTKTYYHFEGVLKTVKPTEDRDRWYFRVRVMPADYEINVDPDLANRDAMTVFVNHKVFDYQGNYLGATGIGLTINFVRNLMDLYQEKYRRNVYFIDGSGNIVLQNLSGEKSSSNIKQMEGLAPMAEQILAAGQTTVRFSRQGSKVHLNARFIPELNWYLLVEQTEGDTIRQIYNALVANLFFCLIITVVVLLLINFTINAYRRKLAELDEEDARLKKINLGQREEISQQNRELREKNNELHQALAEVKTLSGLLPICASCKNIRDDKGYWKKIESYIQEHSNAEFSHGICPVCAKKIYPDEFDAMFPNQNDTE